MPFPADYDPMKDMLIDALNGLGVPDYKAVTAEKAGLAEYVQSPTGFGSGTYRWKREALESCTVEELQTLYAGLKEEQYGD